MAFDEKYKKEVIGETRDIITYDDGRVVDTGWKKNMIVLDLNTLIACLLKEEAGINGIQYWSIGSGEETWGTPSVYQVEELTITADASSTGSVTVTLDGVSTNISVTGGDTDNQVATKIGAETFTGWTTSVTDNVVTFTATTDGAKDTPSYSAGTTGATGTITTTTEGVTAIPTPSPVETDEGCLNEFYRKAIPLGNIDFIDEGGSVTATYTNRLQVSLTFEKAEANGNWREFSILGGNATSTLGTGLAINHRTHGLIEKTDNMLVERIIRFTFK